MDKEAKIGDYIIAIKTVRGECKKGVRYRVKNIMRNGDISKIPDSLLDWCKENLPNEPIITTWEYDTHYRILLNGNTTYSNAEYFVNDICYNRIRKLRVLKRI